MNINEMFDLYVPASGKAETVGGEIVRAVERICYRNYNDGDCIGVGYGKHTCNAPARYLIDNASVEINRMIIDMWGTCYGTNTVDKLEQAVEDYLNNNPQLFEEKNNEDLWDYEDEEEDNVDYDEDDDEY